MTVNMPPHDTSRTAPAPARKDWRNQAVCREVDPELFFPVGNSAVADMQAENAKRVCGRCPVRSECLSWAVETRQESGVWGGLSEKERGSLRRHAGNATEEGVRLAVTHGERIARMARQGRSVAYMADRLGVEHKAARCAFKVVRLLDPEGTEVSPLWQALGREAELRRLRAKGWTLRRCARHLGFRYEVVRLAWRVLQERDAAGKRAAAGMGLAS